MTNSTIKNKKGVCLDCPPGSSEKYLIAKRCQSHYKTYRAKINAEKKEEKEKAVEPDPEAENVVKKAKGINKVSKKRQKENRKYLIDRLQFLAQPGNQRCFIEGCNNRADTIEHTMGRKGYADQWARDNNITLLLDIRFWKPCCNFHNLELERNSDLSEKYQLSKISGKKKIIKR